MRTSFVLPFIYFAIVSIAIMQHFENVIIEELTAHSELSIYLSLVIFQLVFGNNIPIVFLMRKACASKASNPPFYLR